MSIETTPHYDDVYKAMADAHRRRIVSALTQRSMVAGELASLVQLAPNALSFHLKWLRSAGVISMRREGRYLRYRANAPVLQAWQTHVTGAFRLAAAPEFEPVGLSQMRPAPLEPPRQQAAETRVDLPEHEPLPTELL